MANVRVLTDQGQLVFKELASNGTDGVTFQAAASSANYTLTLPNAQGGANTFLQNDGAGGLTWGTSTATLDSAYDNGRIITADAGPVEAAGAGGFLSSHSAPLYGLETTGVERNFRITAGQTANFFEIQIGDADADISDDTFDSFFAIDGANSRLGVGTAAPDVLFHALSTGTTVGLIESSGASSQLNFQDSGSSDNAQVYVKAVGNEMFLGAIGADRVQVSSAGMGVNRLAGLGARLDVLESGNSQVARFHRNGTGAGTAFEVKNEGTGTNLFVDSNGNGLAFYVDQDGSATAAQFDQATANTVIEINQVGDAVGIDFNKTGIGAGICLDIENDGTGDTVFLNTDGNAFSLNIDSEATGQPLIQLAPVTGNTRGDIAFGTARTAAPSSPSEGDLWYDGTEERMALRVTGTGNRTIASRWGPAFNQIETDTIVGGVLTISDGNLQVAAESGTADTLDTISPTGGFAFAAGDTLILRADTGDTITVAHNTGNIHLDASANKVLVNGNVLTLHYNGTDWEQLTTMMVLP